MIQFDRVALAFGGHVLFEDVSFTMQKGERCGLVGRNGSGKSTLLRLIDGELEADKGNISLPKNYQIGYLQQHIHFTQSTVLKEAATSLPAHEKDQLYKAETILFGLGFTKEDMDAPTDKFSGGYHLRLHLAKVLIAEPDCLLLDEPTNYLDILSIRWLGAFLSKWKGEFILITHDRAFMDQVTTHTMGIHRGKVKKMKGTTLDFFQQIVTEEEVHEKTRLKSEKKKAHLQSFIDRFGAKASKATQAQSKKKMLEREPALEKLNRLAELSFVFCTAAFPGKKMLEAKSLSFSYAEEPLIDGFSLDIEKGEKIAIIGKNGRGKSTLLRLLSKDLSAQKGSVRTWDNTQIGYFGQTHIDQLNSNHTIEQEIALANPTLNYTEIKAIAGIMMFPGALSEKKIAVLSGGEKSRVLLGKLIAKPCNLLLLDEPTHHLDIESIEALIDALEDFPGSLVMVTHSELILRRLALDKVIVCKEASQSVFLGDYDTFLEKVGWEEEGKKSSQTKNQTTSRKERAEWIAKRSAALKPIQRQIEAYENKIHILESEQKKYQTACETGTASADLVKEFGICKKQIEECETQLYTLYEQLEKLKQEFIL